MAKVQSNICVVLPYPPTYSETFLTTHVEKLSAIVRYLKHFPVDTDAAYFTRASSDRTEMLKGRAKTSLHRVLNPGKTIYLRNFLRRQKVRILLAEYGGTGVATLGMCKQFGIPLVVHFHGADAYSKENLANYHESYKNMFAYCSAIIAVSKHMVEQLVRLGAPKEKVFYNPCGVEVSKFKRASCLKSPAQILTVGRFVEKKAPYLTILAFKKLLERVPEARLVMVGDGPLYEVCRQLIKSLHIEQAVELKGILNHVEVASLMEQSGVFVQHSLVPESGDSEGTPVSILEAGASGMPVVATKHGGIVDAVLHGKTGFLVDEGDVDGMAEYLYLLLSDRELANHLGHQARNHISQNFNIETSIDNLRGVLERYSRNR